jgi:UDP-glucose 4-epimerase
MTSELCTLVVGGAGYIGSHLVPQLLETGRSVTVIGRSAQPDHELPPSATYLCGDFGQLDLICNLLDTHQEVIHLAYASVPNTSFQEPLKDLLDNLVPSVQLFIETATRSTKLVFISSGGTVYGECIDLPIREDHPTKPISPYGVSKLALESYARLYAATKGLKYVCVRPGNPYGVGQRPFAGQGFIAAAMASALRGKPILIFGERGTVRDYLYVSDLASGIVSALEHGHLSETYNIGSGVGLSNLDVVERIKSVLREIGCEVRIEHLPEREFDVKTNVLDATRLRTDTGWAPTVGFDEGLVSARDWLIQELG